MSRRLIVALTTLLLAPAARAQGQTVEWPAFAGDAGGTRHSPASLITPGNVHTLEVAWTYRTGDYRVGQRGGRFEATPLMIEGTLYVSTPFGRVIALEAATGRERWHHDPMIRLDTGYGDWANRGVATWLDPSRRDGEVCRRRIFVAPVDARLIALDAATGRPCPDFGSAGTVDLNRDLRNPPAFRGEYQVTSPPAVIGGLVVVGSAIADNSRVDAPSGVVRAFDARTGANAWSWDPIPRDPTLRLPGSWEGTGADHTGAANAWAPLAVDEERGLLFVPVGSPSPDYYGGERLGRNDYANSVVALRGLTGEVVWHFQAVHHDLWDYDVPAQPVLVTFRQQGRAVPALVQATKMGHVFVLHRETGAPLHPVEERPVPPSTVPGESAWPTQPFPTLPAPIVPQRLAPEEAWGLTETDRASCRDRIAALRWEGMFTPPSLEGTLVYPGNVGGSNWGGVSYDAERDLLFAPANRLAAAVRLVPRANLAEARRDRPSAETAAQRGTPYGMQRELLFSPSGTPCNPPPWGTLTAIRLSTGVRAWERPLGSLPALSAVGGSEEWGSPNLGGAMNTATGLVFASGGFDERLHAFDAGTGRKLWSTDLPAGGNASPMTYVVDGRQFLVMAVGGHDRMGTRPGDYVVAFALPLAEARAVPPPGDAIPAGQWAGQLIVGGGRYLVTLNLRQGPAGMEGTVGGDLRGSLTGVMQGRTLTVDLPFEVPQEACTGTLQGELEWANHGTMLVGTVRLTGGCSDGQEEAGVVALRASSLSR